MIRILKVVAVNCVFLFQGACEGNIRAPQTDLVNHMTNDVDHRQQYQRYFFVFHTQQPLKGECFYYDLSPSLTAMRQLQQLLMEPPFPHSLLHRVCQELAEWYFQDGCSVLAACCHLAVDDIQVLPALSCHSRLLSGPEVVCIDELFAIF